MTSHPVGPGLLGVKEMQQTNSERVNRLGTNGRAIGLADGTCAKPCKPLGVKGVKGRGWVGDYWRSESAGECSFVSRAVRTDCA